MSGVYTNLAKMRSDQNKDTIKPEPVAVVSPSKETIPSTTGKPVKNITMSTNPQTGKPINRSPTSDHFEKPGKIHNSLRTKFNKALKTFCCTKEFERLPSDKERVTPLL